MESPSVPIAEQVREVVQAAMDAMRVAAREYASPAAAAVSREAGAFRAEIIAIGRKLWERQYVDGNGGNISVRLGDKYVLCTPTMMSKSDLEAGDICLSDLEGNILAGGRARTSELLLHLQIYNANPRARAVVHCHPAYATAFALTGSAPPVGLVSEYEFFIGPAAVAPYETPGTQAFAETVLPFVRDHNTILLTNHGVVCWSDTVTHAEWLVEVLENYCKTCVIAEQIGRPLTFIPDNKIQELLALKRRAGLPDARMSEAPISGALGNAEVDCVVDEVVARLDGRG
jgi:L-fuculose-phosphate aldolase